MEKKCTTCKYDPSNVLNGRSSMLCYHPENTAWYHFDVTTCLTFWDVKTIDHGCWEPAQK